MELLIKGRDAYHRNEIEDLLGCYKRGDPVVLMPDGHIWGRLEVAPTFWKIRLAGAPSRVVQPFVEPHWDGIWVRGDGAPRQKIRRRWKFSPEILSPAGRIALFRGDTVSIDWDTWLRCVHDKSQEQGRGLVLMGG